MADLPERVRQFESIIGYKFREKSRVVSKLFLPTLTLAST
jgi:hypothetical protein